MTTGQTDGQTQDKVFPISRSAKITWHKIMKHYYSNPPYQTLPSSCFLEMSRLSDHWLHVYQTPKFSPTVLHKVEFSINTFTFIFNRSLIIYDKSCKYHLLVFHQNKWRIEVLLVMWPFCWSLAVSECACILLILISMKETVHSTSNRGPRAKSH